MIIIVIVIVAVLVLSILTYTKLNKCCGDNYTPGNNYKSSDYTPGVSPIDDFNNGNVSPIEVIVEFTTDPVTITYIKPVVSYNVSLEWVDAYSSSKVYLRIDSHKLEIYSQGAYTANYLLFNNIDISKYGEKQLLISDFGPDTHSSEVYFITLQYNP